MNEADNKANAPGGKARFPGAVTLRILAALLGYPDARMRSHLPEMVQLLHREHTLPAARAVELQALMAALLAADPLAGEATYVELFDRGRATSLHLFEHVHGDSRDRGPAMIDLGQTYAKADLFLAEGELPDYLPAVLEFVSTQPTREAKAFLGEISHLLKGIFGALHKRESPYASVLGALLELAGEKAEAVEPAPEPPMDESWAEPVVFDGCSTQGQAKPGQLQPVRIVRKADHAKGASA